MTQKMPVLFVGHGSPMNAIEENEFVKGWRTMGMTLPRPGAILCISAHWESVRPAVSLKPDPETIHDFWGFPEELHALRYPATGCREAAAEVASAIAAAGLPVENGVAVDDRLRAGRPDVYAAVFEDEAAGEGGQQDLRHDPDAGPERGDDRPDFLRREVRHQDFG